jgi:hypothetical protein
MGFMAFYIWGGRKGKQKIGKEMGNRRKKVGKKEKNKDLKKERKQLFYVLSRHLSITPLNFKCRDVAYW